MIVVAHFQQEASLHNPLRLSMRSRTFTVLLLALLVCGCYRPTKAPIETIHYGAPNINGRHLLFVFLHGYGDPISVFDKEGFIAAVRSRGLPVDMSSVDANIGYYMNGTILKKLREDVIGPAGRRGTTTYG